MKQVRILTGLLAVSLAMTYYTWFGDSQEASPDDPIALYRASTGDLKSISWVTDTLEVRISRKDDAHGNYSWIEVTERTVSEPPNPPDHNEASNDPDQKDDTPSPKEEVTPEPEPEETIEFV